MSSNSSSSNGNNENNQLDDFNEGCGIANGLFVLTQTSYSSNNLAAGSTSSNRSTQLVSDSTRNNHSVDDTPVEDVEDAPAVEYQVVYLNNDGEEEVFGFDNEDSMEDWGIAVRGIKLMANKIYDDGEQMRMEGNDSWYGIACARYRRWLMEIHVLIDTFGRGHVPKHIKNSMRNVEEQLGVEITFPLIND